MILAPWILLLGILSALALPPVLKEKSWQRFFIAMVLSFVGVVLPLFVFFFSCFMEPEWKGACVYGWLDCFIAGKMALTPIMLWATAALYAVEILHVEKPAAKWIVLGIFLGATVAAVCLGFELFSIDWQSWWREWRFEWRAEVWVFVPAYVAVWYSVRAWHLIKVAKLNLWNYFLALLGSLPFWLLSIWWSKSIYATLPDKSPDGCFVVTAAARGHRNFVGPFFQIERNGSKRLANQQLLTFWQLENLWRVQSPDSHALFRKIYNRVGPVLARRIASPWLADLTFIALKPVELVAKLISTLLGKIERLANHKL
jgi:hypothetical protein